MIEFNLLPTVKMDYIKAQRSRRLMFTVSVLISVVTIVLLIGSLTYEGFQKKHLSDVNKDIVSETSELKNKPDINRILTVQNQLESLTALHAGKPNVSSLFEYLNEVTPSKVSISNFAADFTADKVTVTGATDTLSSVNQFVDTLKFTTYKTDDGADKVSAFSNVVLESYGLNTQTAGGNNASYSVSFTYDPTIFNITKKITLTVPSITTTRSAISSPTDLFQASTTPAKAGN